MQVKVIVISGSMGAGKTTVLGEASDVLAERGVRHAAVDLDAIGTVLLPDDAAARLALQNLADVYRNLVAAGIARILLAEAVETRDDLERLRHAMPGADLALCRLTADLEILERRIRIREPGMCQDRFVARSRMLHQLLEAAKLEDFVVPNDGRVTDAAREMLLRAGWIQ